MLISIVIPHFNQEDDLRLCLDHLVAQVDCPAKVEILVVDNGSQQMPAALCACYPGVRLISEKTPGPGPARNTGALAAGGDILAFIDADCRASSGWLSVIEGCFGDPTTQIIGGDVRIFYADPANPRFIEPYEAVYSFRNRQHIREGFSVTANMAIRRPIFGHVGPFAGIDISEDRDWGLRAIALGYMIVYVPAMVVLHPARKSFDELTRKWDRHIAHDYQERAMSPSGKAHWLARAIAIAASPLAEIPTILTSRRLRGWKERGLAFIGLWAIRLYRSQAMLRMLIDRRRRAANAWRR